MVEPTTRAVSILQHRDRSRVLTRRALLGVGPSPPPPEKGSRHGTHARAPPTVAGRRPPDSGPRGCGQCHSGLDAARIDSRKTLSLARDIFGDNLIASLLVVSKRVQRRTKPEAQHARGIRRARPWLLALPHGRPKAVRGSCLRRDVGATSIWGDALKVVTTLGHHRSEYSNGCPSLSSRPYHTIPCHTMPVCVSATVHTLARRGGCTGSDPGLTRGTMVLDHGMATLNRVCKRGSRCTSRAYE